MQDRSVGLLLSLTFVMREKRLPSLAEEYTVVNGTHRVAEPQQLFDFEGAQLLDVTDLQRRHHARQVPACVSNVGKRRLKDRALDNGAVKHRAHFICRRKEVTYDIGRAR